MTLASRLAPARLGRDFRWIWGASSVSNLGDGIVLAAGPLLVASITREPFAVAMAAFLQQLPWLLFGVPAGAVIDRLDRRILTIVVDLLRFSVLALLALAVALDLGSLPVVFVAVFLLGTSETFADNAASTLVATAVPKDGLGLANSRLFGTAILANQLAGPPLGAFLFGVGMAVPFGVNALCFLLAAVLISRISKPVVERSAEPRAMRHEVAEGLRWLWSHAPVRTLALTITAFNVTFGAAMAVYVLYATELLGLGEFGYGLLMTASAVGGITGAATYRWLEERFSLATLMRIGLVVETLTHLGLALTREPILAGLIMAIFGVHAVVWGTTSTTVRQRAVPSHLLGRVTSVYLLGGVGGLALGSVLGGALAQRWGVVAPYWFGFVGSALLTVVMWRSFLNIAHAAEVGPEPDEAAIDAADATRPATDPARD
ncbi:MAG TPA: MFS transporter [Nocardioidaceae bacterium]|nr:MFS transporter [Nocardioidaceae bacterium]